MRCPGDEELSKEDDVVRRPNTSGMNLKFSEAEESEELSAVERRLRAAEANVMSQQSAYNSI